MKRSLAIGLSIAVLAVAACQRSQDEVAGPRVSITVATGAPIPRERMPGSGELVRTSETMTSSQVARRAEERVKLATNAGDGGAVLREEGLQRQ